MPCCRNTSDSGSLRNQHKEGKKVLPVLFFSSAYDLSSISGLKLCSSLCNSVFTRAVPRYPFSLCDELQHPEHTSIIRDPYSYNDGEQMAAHEE